jgi:hypothetical protein
MPAEVLLVTVLVQKLAAWEAEQEMEPADRMGQDLAASRRSL